MIGELGIHVNDEGSYEVHVNGTKMQNVRSVDLHIDAESVPSADIQVSCKPDTNLMSYINCGFDFNAGLTDAVNVLRLVTSIDTDIRDGFLASIESALKESKIGEDTRSVSERIFKRVFGED